MWLLENTTKLNIEAAEAAGFTPTAQQMLDFTTSRGDGVLTIAGSTAEIQITGVLTKRPSFMAMLFGGGNGTYGDIAAALASADADPSVTDITLNIDSPGGTVDGLFDAMAAIQTTRKPVTARVDGQACSAAYALAAQADSIVAANKYARVGSVGVAASMYADTGEVTVTSTQAPKKRPDITTDAGRADIRAELDAMHDLFVDDIAAGRKTTAETVNAKYGQGATLMATQALELGMVDAIGTPTPDTKKPNTPTAMTLENKTMDLATLQTQHPATFAAAVKIGTDNERDRVTAHAMMGESSGAMATALAAIKDGSAMTMTLSAAYMTAGMARNDIANRADDEPKTDAATATATAENNLSDTDAAALAVANLVAHKAGVKI